jgi:SAM-dependent methyltransferase
LFGFKAQVRYLRTANAPRSIIDRDRAARYRESDELEIYSGSYWRICNTLKEISLSFDRPISALDLGCGTGRYFRCLRNVQALTAVDASSEMLKQARNPTGADSVTVGRIELVCADILDLRLTGRFDFIYSIGVFGEHAPWDLPTCNKLFDWLAPEGKLFVTLIDVFSQFRAMSWKRRLAESVNLFLPDAWKARVRKRLRTYFVTEREVRRIFRKSRFRYYEIQKHVSTARLWRGAHFDCLAVKHE